MQSVSVEVIRYDGQEQQELSDVVAIEEPLEIRLAFLDSEGVKTERSVAVTMRTPGEDTLLAAGFLFSEGLLRDSAAISKISHCGPFQNGKSYRNIIRIELCRDVQVNLESIQRNFFTTSSCGVCGKASIEALKFIVPKYKDNKIGPIFSNKNLIEFPEILRRHQKVFQNTGGLHGAALFNQDCRLLCTMEDVGRHNAVDKLVGEYFLKEKLPLNEHALMLSGRISFELIQKAAMAGIRFVVAIGAPSSLAIKVAEQFNITLVGFLRKQKFNVYSGKNRIS